jgi:hypothetical protein
VASIVDICNTALGYLGDDATVASIDPPEGSPQADHCARLYPIARDSALESHAWGFATARKALGDPLGTTRDGWTYVYAAPSDMLKPQAVLPDGWTRDDDPVEFTVEIDDTGQTLILTDEGTATLRYTRKITDTGKFTPLFVDALAWMLASKLAGPVLKGDAGRVATVECYKMFLAIISPAKASDANAQRVNNPELPASIKARL